MGRTIPYDTIPDSGTLIDDGAMVEFEIESMQPATSNTGKLMYKAAFRAVAPDQYSGSVVFENYTIGTDDDPNVDDPNTWKLSVGSKNWKRLMRAANVPMTGDEETDLLAAKGCRFVALIGVEKDETGKYQDKNRIKRVYSLGERQPEAPPAASTNGGGMKAPVVARPVGRPSMPGRPA